MLEPAELLKRAVAAVDEAAVPEDLREVAFSKAFELLSAGGEAPTGTPAQPPPPASPPAGLIAKAAAALRVEVEHMQFVFRVEDDQLVLDIPASRLPGARAARQRDITLILPAARQAAGESQTEWDVIRQACEDYAALDRNLSTNTRELDELSFRGSNRKPAIVVRKPGLEAAASRITELATGG